MLLPLQLNLSPSGGSASPITRLSLDGYGAKRAGSFAGKTPDAGGGGSHPVGIITRLALDGYGARRTGSFSGKTPSGGGGGGAHPVGILTRLSLDGYGSRRARFTAKTPTEQVQQGGGGLLKSFQYVLKKKEYLFLEELEEGLEDLRALENYELTPSETKKNQKTEKSQLKRLSKAYETELTSIQEAMRFIEIRKYELLLEDEMAIVIAMMADES